jgi:hypothetical protein
MEQVNRFIVSVSGALGIDSNAVILGLVLLLLALLFFFRRNPWGAVKGLLILAALGGLAYFSYRLVVVGLHKKEALIENSDAPPENQP